MKCQNCGGELPDESKFCPFCRSAVSRESALASAQKLCPVCKTPVEADARFCTNCRSPLLVAAPVARGPVCPNCGQPCQEGSEFCTSCGYQIRTKESPSGPGTSAFPPPAGPVGETRGIPRETGPAGNRLGPPRRVQFLKTPVIWIAAPVVALAIVLMLLLRPWSSSPPATASIMVDDFTQDQSLNTGLWTINGPTARVFHANIASPTVSFVSPRLTFSPQNGLAIRGAANVNQVATVESIASFSAPFSLSANVMTTRGGNFVLLLSDASGHKGVGIGGGPASPGGPGVIDYIAPEGAGWRAKGTLSGTLQANTWYTLSTFVDARGNASLRVQSGNDTVGHATVGVGQGRFYIMLVQNGSGEPASTLGRTHWRSIEILSGAGVPQILGESISEVRPQAVHTTGLGVPTIADPVIADSQTSLSLPSGNSIYLYGMATGGAAPSTAFSSGEYAQVSDAAGQLAAALAATPENVDGFTTETGYHTIGAVGVSGFSHYSASYGSNGSSGAPYAEDTFSVTQRSLVVVIGLAASQQSVEFTGIPGLSTDPPSSAERTSEGVAIAHAYLPPGAYTVTEHSTARAGGQDPNHMADLVGVFVFY